MSTINSLQRVKMALAHKEPDRIPFDLGGTVVTGMNKVTYKNLRNYLGLPARKIELYDPIQQLARIHQDVLARLKVDVRNVDPSEPDNNPLVTEITRDGDYYSFQDEWGITWNMPVEGGFYFDMRKHPLAEVETIDELKKYPWPDPLDDGRFRTMKKRADNFVQEEEKAYVLGRNGAGVFELALWMRGFENFFVDLTINTAYAETLLDILTEIKIKYWKRALEEVGENVLIVSEADDLATQESLLISRDMYKKFISPRHKKIFNCIKENARNKVYIFYHTCGAVKELIPDLIEEGVDILNPVQISANGIDTAELKQEFGDEITFWGGGVDTQRILPNGTPQEVKDEVKKRIDDLAPGGGFIFNPVHNVQGDVPPENYMAMWETLQDYGVY